MVARKGTLSRFSVTRVGKTGSKACPNKAVALTCENRENRENRENVSKNLDLRRYDLAPRTTLFTKVTKEMSPTVVEHDDAPEEDDDLPPLEDAGEDIGPGADYVKDVPEGEDPMGGMDMAQLQEMLKGMGGGGGMAGQDPTVDPDAQG